MSYFKVPEPKHRETSLPLLVARFHQNLANSRWGFICFLEHSDRSTTIQTRRVIFRLLSCFSVVSAEVYFAGFFLLPSSFLLERALTDYFACCVIFVRSDSGLRKLFETIGPSTPQKSQIQWRVDEEAELALLFLALSFPGSGSYSSLFLRIWGFVCLNSPTLELGSHRDCSK